MSFELQIMSYELIRGEKRGGEYRINYFEFSNHQIFKLISNKGYIISATPLSFLLPPCFREEKAKPTPSVFLYW